MEEHYNLSESFQKQK